MITLIHDGTFEGLLSCIYEAFYSREKPDTICGIHEFTPNLLSTNINVTTDLEKAKKVSQAIKSKISSDAMRKINYAYLSEQECAGMIIFNYLKLGFKLGSKVDLHMNHDAVLGINKLEWKVKIERHRMLGFVRFKGIGDFFYSAIEPDNNVLSLISGHFAARLRSECFILHDLKREIAFFYNKGESGYAPLLKKESECFSKDNRDHFYTELWKEFYETISIVDRKNLKLQKNYMPVRYWKHLTELK